MEGTLKNGEAVNGVKIRKHKNKNTLFIILMLAYPVLQFSVFFIYVNINTVVMSFQDTINGKPGEALYNFNNYKLFIGELFTRETWWIAIKNSLLATLNNNFIMLPLSLLTGYFFYKKVLGDKVFKVIFFLPSIISIVVLSAVYMYMFNPEMGLFPLILRNLGFETIPDFFTDGKYAFGLVLLYCNWAGVGYSTLVLSGNINKIPKEIMEYGQLEGVGLMRELWTIVVPCIWPIVSTMLVTGSMTMFTFFIQVQIMTRGTGDSMTLAYRINNWVIESKWEQAAAAGIVLTIVAAPILILIKNFTGKFFNEVEF